MIGSRIITLCITVAALCGCNRRPPTISPQIEFTLVPPAHLGGGENLDPIEGRVRGAQPGQRIVLFAKGDVWWVQPFSAKRFTTINPDATWKSSTHSGTEYAALLVEPGYVPPLKTDALPSSGGSVVAVATVKGGGFQQETPKTIQFSGYDWEVRQIPSDRGGATNDFDPANAWTDRHGRLHLQITRGQARWKCAEVTLRHSPGYGTYRFVVRQVKPLEPAAVLGMYTWDASAIDENHREMDIEISRWGDLSYKNAQFVIQPYYVPANVIRFSLPSGTLTHSLHWSPGRVEFKTVEGSSHNFSSRTLASYSFTSGVPSPGGESWYIGLYAYRKAKYPLRNETEVLIERFEYLP